MLAQTRPVTLSLFTAGEGELVAVKSIDGATAAAQLRRVGEIMASPSSPYVLPCLDQNEGAPLPGPE